MTPRVFFVDDDDSLRRVVSRELTDAGFDVRAFPSAGGVLEALRESPPDALLIDLLLPGVGGLELLKSVRAMDDAAQVVLLTGHGAVPEAVEAMRLGAHDFLTKPVPLDVLEQTLRRAVEKRALLDDNARLRRALEAGARAPELYGTSPAMERLRGETERVAASASNVLVLGENGTGKELVARRIHALSSRSQAPFVVVNCGAVPEALVESELFGHEKGAFTGADRRRVGLFEAAHGGTLFLDEVGELSRTVQPALLRAIQFGEVRAVGSDCVRQVDVRIVAATNRDLTSEVAEGNFREDLYYRLATLLIEVPPLRQRRADVAELFRRALVRCAERAVRDSHGPPRVFEVDEAALAELEAYDWPGNVRELENAAERVCVMAEGDAVDVRLVRRYVLREARGRGSLPTLEVAALERMAIEAAMERHAGDKRAAAAEVGVALKTLYNKLERYRDQDASPD